METINDVMQGYVDRGEMSGGALIVRKEGDEVFRGKWGFADLAAKTPIEYDNIYRLMSMTKGVTAVAVMTLVEQGLLGLDDPVSRHLPAFAEPRVVKGLWTRPASREITIRDLLSHASGLQQGLYGLIRILLAKPSNATLAERIDAYGSQALDFEPGTKTSYSPAAGFDTLGRIVEVVSGKTFEEYLQETIFRPLGMTDTTFHPTNEQTSRCVRVYKRKKDQLMDVTYGKDDLYQFLKMADPEQAYEAGCGGLFGTVEDYDKLVQMLANGGTYNGTQILKPETVALMHAEAQPNHLEPFPGTVWGLGFLIRQDPVKYESCATAGTYGWSGAFGTHFFISPDDHLTAVFMTNRTDLGGSGSYISKKVEELVFGTYGGAQ